MIKYGVMRIVLLVGPYAIKFPSPRYGWVMFLRGLLSDMSETRQGKPACRCYYLCPVLFSVPGGWMIVMRRAQPLPDGMWHEGLLPNPPRNLDDKAENFGLLDGTVVLLDYGERP